MAIDDGNYVFLCATNTGLALDITGGKDRAGADLELWTRKDNDAQTFHVTTDASGYSMLYLPLTGKSLDVYGGTAASGTKVIQWDDHGGDNQRWVVVPDGGSVTIADATYDTYTIESKLDTSLSIGAASVARGSKCTLRPTGLRLAAVPVQSVQDGLYQIVSGLQRDVAVDVAGASKASGANLQLWGLHGNNNQVFSFEAMADGTVRIAGCDTGYVVDASEALVREATKRNNVLVWPWHGGQNQRWVVFPDGTLTRNGTTVPGYQIVCRSGTNLALDACGASSKPGTNVWLWTRDASNMGQVWELRPAQALGADLECPADVMHDLGDWSQAVVLGADGVYAVRPSWVGARGKWQVRYRTRARVATMYPGERTAWSSWTCLLDGSTANGGWGEVGVDNCTPTRRSGRWWAPQTIDGTLDPTTVDLVDVEYEVRRFTADWQGRGWCAHSGSASRVCTVAWAPSLSVDSAELSPSGLSLTCSMDWPRGGNVVRADVFLAGGTPVASDVVAEDFADGESVMIDLADLALVPEDGASLVVSWDVETSDGVRSSGTSTATLAYADDAGTVADPTVTDLAGWVKELDFGSSSPVRVFAETEDGLVEFEADGAVCDVLYPLGSDYGIVAVVGEEGGSWGVWRASYSSKAVPYYVFDMDDGYQAAVKCGIGEPVKESRSTTMDHDEAMTAGGGFESVRVGASLSETVDVSGALAHWLDTDAQAGYERLRTCRFCWFRDPFGHVWRVAVTDCTQDRSRSAWSEVRVGMRRVG